jgi:hypothetical protein
VQEESSLHSSNPLQTKNRRKRRSLGYHIAFDASAMDTLLWNVPQILIV